MKKILLLMLITLTLVACAKRERVMNEYEVLLPTKDTMYVNAWYYDYSIATFTNSKTYVFYDTERVEIIRIHNPIFIREVKKKRK
jgi:hypothetical protein